MTLGWDGFEKQLIVGATVSSRPHLFHYTNFAGLSGIVLSQQLRATHFSDLNDSTEVVHIRLFLRNALIESAQKAVLSYAIAHPTWRFSVKKFQAVGRPTQLKYESAKMAVTLKKIGEQTFSTAREIAEFLTDNTLDILYEHVIGNENRSFFVASFCAHELGSYEYDNGLLSQWRGYGAGGGYCLVFDTVKLWRLIEREYDAAAYMALLLDSVEYASRDFSETKIWTELSTVFDAHFRTQMSHTMESGSEALRWFILKSCFLKHQAFREEGEIRIVAFPTPKAVRRGVMRTRRTNAPALKKVGIHPAGRRRFITLFDAFPAELPLVRVIVGPGADQVTRLGEARAICGPGIEVFPSVTPYVP